MPRYVIAPSILSADFAHLGTEVHNVLSAGADWIHFDVMDNHFVPNLTMGPMGCEALRNDNIEAPIDVHLMVTPADQLIPAFVKAGATSITFHPESSQDIQYTLNQILDSGCQGGLAVNPLTPLSCLRDLLELIDIILIMSVNPGFGGQSLLPSTYQKLTEARSLIDESGHNIRLEVDGGVNIDNIRPLAEAGADTFVAGSSIFGSSNYRNTITAMHAALK